MSSEEYYRYPLGKSPSYLKEWKNIIIMMVNIFTQV